MLLKSKVFEEKGFEQKTFYVYFDRKNGELRLTDQIQINCSKALYFNF